MTFNASWLRYSERMTEPTTYEPGEIRDFTLPQAPHQFRIDDDIFSAPGILSPVTLSRFAKMHAEFSTGLDLQTEEGIDRAIDMVARMFAIIMPGPSGRRFAERLKADGEALDIAATARYLGLSVGTVEQMLDDGLPEQAKVYQKPIDLQRQALPALYYLLECYGMRPTPQSSPLPSDSMTGDSEDGQLVEVSTGDTSPTPLNF